jgi:hypothetical protein
VTFEDGFRGDLILHEGRPAMRWTELSAAERPAWAHVAEVQRLGIVEGIRAVEPLLEAVDAWPAEPQVLAWARRVCLHHGLAGPASRFEQRLAAGRLPGSEAASLPRPGSGPLESWLERAVRAQLAGL